MDLGSSQGEQTQAPSVVKKVWRLSHLMAVAVVEVEVYWSVAVPWPVLLALLLSGHRWHLLCAMFSQR